MRNIFLAAFQGVTGQKPSIYSIKTDVRSSKNTKKLFGIRIISIQSPYPYTVYTSPEEGFKMASPVLSFRVEDVLVEKLDRLSVATDRDRQYHLKRALARYVESESWHINAIAEGVADAEAGNLTDLKAVKAKWVNRGKNRADGQSGQ